MRPKDIFMLILATGGDLYQEVRDPLCILSSGYEAMYGFVPKHYKRKNFYQMVQRSLRTGDIERVVKNGKEYLRLTSVGKSNIQRDFPLSALTQRWNGRWVIVSFDIAEKMRKSRNFLREKLRSIGFGMLQQSMWITPLPIGKDVLELIESYGLLDEVFVLEVSGMLLGDPRILAQKVWKLEKWEEGFYKLKGERDRIKQLHEGLDGRRQNRERKYDEYKILKRRFNSKYLEFISSLPGLPKELFSFEISKLRPLL